MKFSKYKDRAAQIFVIVIAFLIFYGIETFTEEFDKGEKFTVNAVGITYQVIGFLLIMWASSTKIHLKSGSVIKYEGDKTRIISAIVHPLTWQLGMTMILLGLMLQFLGLDFSDLNSLSI